LNVLTRSNGEPGIPGAKAVKEKPHCQLLDIALATVVDAVIGTDAHDRITFFNPAAEAMTGWRSSEALGKSLTQVFFLIDQENDKVIDSPLDRLKHGPAETAGMTQPQPWSTEGAFRSRSEIGGHARAPAVCRCRDRRARRQPPVFTRPGRALKHGSIDRGKERLRR
jgi:PAS domain-containing protein